MAPTIVRVRGFQQNGAGLGVVQKVTATSTAPRLQSTGGHVVHRLAAVTAHPDPVDGYLWLDLVATDDATVAPQGRRWRLTLWNGSREARSWVVDVPADGAPLVRFGADGREDPDGTEVLPARWLTDLDDFADEVSADPVRQLSNYYTRAQIDQRLRDLVLSGGGAQLLDDLQDVDTAAAAPGDALVREGDHWTARPLTYPHDQTFAAKTWLIAHPVARPSGVRVTGPDGQQLYPRRVTFPQPGQCVVAFTVAQVGTALVLS